MSKRIVDIEPILKDLAEQCLSAKGLECSILGNVIDRLRAAPVLSEKSVSTDADKEKL